MFQYAPFRALIIVGAGLSREGSHAVHGTGLAGVRGPSPLVS